MVKANGTEDRPNIMEIMFKDWNKDMGNYIIQMVIFTKEILLRTKEKDMDKCFGQTEAFIKDNGKKAHRMEKAKSIKQEEI